MATFFQCFFHQDKIWACSLDKNDLSFFVLQKHEWVTMEMVSNHPIKLGLGLHWFVLPIAKGGIQPTTSKIPLLHLNTEPSV